MRTKLISMAVAAVVAAGWFWWFGRSPSPEFSSAEAAVASPAFREAVARGDSAGIARLALRQCRVEGEPCYQAFLLSLADSNRIALAMGALEVIAAGDDRVRREGHDYAHVVGMRGFDPALPVGETFSSCTVNFQSGCYHGVIQAYLTGIETIRAEDVSGLCDSVQSAQESLWLRFQCAHGLGHGLVMRYGHDLPKGLAGCDLLPTDWDRQSCYGGAFMENVIATDAHEMPVRTGSSGDEHGGHGSDGGHGTHGGQATTVTLPASDWERVKRADAHYPCSVLNDHYKRSCYGMQTSIMLELTGYDFRQTARLCDGAPAAYRTTCYQSLGTNISGNTGRNIRRSIETCRLGTERYQPWCFLGVVKNFIDVTSNPQDGLVFCAEVPAGPNELMCYRAVGEELGILYADHAPRRTWCDRVAEGDRRQACRFGANLSSDAPEGMPRVELLAGEP